MNGLKLTKLGQKLVIASFVGGSSLLATKKFAMPSKIEADSKPKISRKNIEDEDGAIFLSSLSVLNRRESSQKWDTNWDK